MLIIIEGQDRCGKSTLIDNIRSLARNPNVVVMHEGKPPKGVDPYIWSNEHYRHYFLNIQDIVHSGGLVISDRSHLGETVYGPKYRKYDADYIWTLEKQYIPYIMGKVHLILLTDSPENIIWRSDGKSLERDKEELANTRQAFIEAFDKTIIKDKIHINLEKTKFEDVFKTVKEHFRWRE